LSEIRRMKFSWKKVIRNKYVVATFAFLIWITFINDIDLPFILKSKAELRDMEERLEFYRKENELIKESLDDLTTNKASLEKFAREQYYMRKKNEDVFVIREKDN